MMMEGSSFAPNLNMCYLPVNTGLIFVASLLALCPSIPSLYVFKKMNLIQTVMTTAFEKEKRSVMRRRGTVNGAECAPYLCHAQTTMMVDFNRGVLIVFSLSFWRTLM